MEIMGLPFCCTSAVLGMFGEHGEESEVSVKEIKRLINSVRNPQFNDEGRLVFNGKRLILATSINPATIALLIDYGFNEIDNYEGVQGTVHVLAYHA